MFKHEKMGIKGVPFGYLEFSCAFGGKSCPHARVCGLLGPAPGHSPGPGCGCEPGSVLFGPSHTDAKASRVLDADPPATRIQWCTAGRNCYNSSDKNSCNGSNRSRRNRSCFRPTGSQALLSVISKHRKNRRLSPFPLAYRIESIKDMLKI